MVPPPIRILYLASLRERVGRADERVEPPAGCATLAALVAWLVARGDAVGAALAADRSIRASVNHRLARGPEPVGPGDEVAFFPPFTGG